MKNDILIDNSLKKTINFLYCFGYEASRESKNIYNKVTEQSENLKKIFTSDELEQLQNIN